MRTQLEKKKKKKRKELPAFERVIQEQVHSKS